MNTIPASRSDMGAHDLQNGIFRHIASGGPEDGIQDHGDVTHHASNIFLAGVRETEQPVRDIFICFHSPASIYIVNPICELVFRYIPVTIGDSVTGHLYLLNNTPTSAVHHQLASLDL